MADLDPLRARVSALLKAAPAATRDIPGDFVDLHPDPLEAAFHDALEQLGGAPLDRTPVKDGVMASGTGHLGPDVAVLGADGRAVLSLGSAYWIDADQVDLHLVLGDDTLISTVSVDACSQSKLTVTGRGDPARVKVALDVVCLALERHLAPLRWKA